MFQASTSLFEKKFLLVSSLAACGLRFTLGGLRYRFSATIKIIQQLSILNYPGSECFHPGSPSKIFSVSSQNIFSKLSEIWSGLFIPDPVPDFLPIPDPGVKKAPVPDPDPQHTVWPWHLSSWYLGSDSVARRPAQHHRRIRGGGRQGTRRPGRYSSQARGIVNLKYEIPAFSCILV